MKSFGRAPILWIAAIALASLPLAGCLTGPPAEHPTSTAGPDWIVGQWWRYTIEGTLPAPWVGVRPFDLENSEIDHLPKLEVSAVADLVAVPHLDDPDEIPRRVVADDKEIEFMSRFGLPFAANWALNAGTAWSHRFGDWNTIRSQSFNPYLEGARFFDWPLSDGKRWTTEFMHTELEMVARQTADGFSIQSYTQGGEMVLEYTYAREAQWFGEFNVLDGAGGILLRAKLVDHGASFEGTVFAFDRSLGDESGCLGWPGPLPLGFGFCPPFPSEVDSDKGAWSLWVHFAYLSEGPGTMTVLRDGPEGMEVWHTDACPCDESFTRIEENPDPGRYVWSVNDVGSGDRWIVFHAVSRCFGTYDVTGDLVEPVELCSRE